ncbi:DUF4340 domain-containing protein [Schlesneria sp.]|uniref:DUF4340 domain-containing protein n=1 Tax=Schlesneria sp. TaxID=2762018 RepID=UPI002F0A648E
MNETVRTSLFVAGAVLSLIAAQVTSRGVTKPPAEFSQVGTPFYPDFVDADAAKSLQVVNYNPETASLRIFGVEQGSDGVWRIPSRNNYPVDGKERLGKTATSIIGIKKEALAGPRKSQHIEFGVLDPLSESVSDYQGVGNRVTLKDGKDGKVLADLIIGKEVKGRSGFFYVRNPSEDQTYIAKVSIDVSTKFADWIEPDLLKLDGSKLRYINIEKHSVEFGQDGGGSLAGKESNQLTRTSATDKWKLDGLDDATEEVNEDEVRKLVQALDDLKIVGVRPKNEKLKKRLQDDQGLALDDRTRREMEEIGFFFVRMPDRKGMAMISQEGDLAAVTEQGVAYELHFGSVFSGTEEEVEAGFINKGEEKSDANGKEAENKEKNDEADAKTDARKIKSRYLFAQAQFDPSALGPKPEAPVRPEAPAEAAAANEDTPADAAAAENVGEKPDPKKAYEEALAKYDIDLKKYEADVKAYEEKVKTGEKLVKDLNRRFADWYYVISGDSFENLRQGRKTLVKPKSTPENAAGQSSPAGNVDAQDAPDSQDASAN